MAGETTRIAKAGDPLRISARKWNALNNLLGERPSRLPGMGIITDSETLILVRNDTGDTLEPFSVVKVGNSLPLPTLNEDEWRYRRIFEGVNPVASETFAITQDGIGSGDVGPALIIGVTTCTLNVADEADTHASPDDDDTDDLHTGTSGSAAILWKESGTGAGKKAKILLLGKAGGSSGGVEVLKIQAGAANAFGYPARVQQQDATTGALSDVDATEVRVLDPNGGTWAADEYAAVAKFLGTNVSDVDCYSGVPPAAASGSSVPDLDVTYLASTINATFTGALYEADTTAICTLGLAGYYQLVVHLVIPVSTGGSPLYRGWLYESTYGGGPSSDSIEFLSGGANNGGTGTPPRRCEFAFRISGTTFAHMLCYTAFVRADEDSIRLGLHVENFTEDFFLIGGTAPSTNIAAWRIGDL